MPPDPNHNKDMFNRQRSGVYKVQLLASKNNVGTLPYLTHLQLYLALGQSLLPRSVSSN